MPRLSVIIPAYNIGKYIEPCLKSIAEQTFEDFEVLIIDDGSTDDTGERVKRIIAEDERFYIIRQENRGVSSARNRGIRESSGDLICFVDADDWIEPDMCRTLVAGMEDPQCDVAVCGVVKEPKRDSFLPSVLDFPMNRTLQVSHQLRLQLFEKPLGPVCCNKIYRRKLLIEEGIFYSEDLNNSEDEVFNLNFFDKAKHVVFFDNAAYHYRQRTGSAVHSFREDSYINELRGWAVREFFLKKWGADDERCRVFRTHMIGQRLLRQILYVYFPDNKGKFSKKVFRLKDMRKTLGQCGFPLKGVPLKHMANNAGQFLRLFLFKYRFFLFLGILMSFIAFIVFRIRRN